MVSNIIPESEKVIHDYVKFENVLINYDISHNFEVEFSLDKSVKGSSKDWIGIFHAGWNSYESFLVYEYALGVPCDETGRRRKVKFFSKYIQHAKPGAPYQFVYINKYLEIMGVSQYFQFIVNSQKGLPVSVDAMCEISFPSNEESSPVKESDPKATTSQNDKDKNLSEKNLISSDAETYSTCKLYSISKWKDSCTFCYHCRGIFQMKESHDKLLEQIKQYQELNFALQNRVDHLEKWLEWEKKKETNNLKTCMFHWSETVVDSAIKSSACGQGENNGVFTHDCYDWDFSSKELYLKAVIGQQELTIRDLNKVICELGYIDQPKWCTQPSMSIQDTVKKIRAEERVVAEIYDINNNTSEEEF